VNTPAATRHAPKPAAPSDLGRAIEEYLVACRARGVKRMTIENQYGYPLRHVLLPWCVENGITRPEEVDQRTLDRWGHDLEEYGGKRGKLSPSSLATYRRSANQFLKWSAGEEGRAPRLKVGKFSARQVETLERRDISRLEEVAMGLGRHRDAVVIRLLGDTGMRPTEALRLRGADIQATSRRRWVRVRGQGSTSEGKGWEDRELDITPGLHRRLKELTRSEDEPIFRTLRRDRVTREFEPLTLDGLEQAVKTIAAEAEIGKKVIPETFRHSYCRTMLLKGMPERVLEKLMGHGSDRMIRLHYGKIESQQANAMAMRLLKDDSE
jgi:integrase